jgi:Domain of unknown function (DUF6371)/Zinc beta-ribbon finger, putative
MYKYTLHKSSKKHLCPNCEKKRFVLYIDVETGNFISPKVGRCDREINCGYHYPPKSFFQDNNQEYVSKVDNTIPNSSSGDEYHFHASDELNKSLTNFDKNKFIEFLRTKFDTNKIEEMMSNYKIGTAQNNYYGTVFWQIDVKQKIRGGKIISYDSYGKRSKYINWVHSIKTKQNQIQEFNLNQCLFGEHLLKTSEKVIAIVESEKTACIMSMLFNKYLWLATGSLNGLTSKKVQVLKNSKIILYPDLGIDGLNGSPFSIWKMKCDQLKKVGFDIEISNLLEKKGTDYDKKNGYDIADYFLKRIDKKPKKILTSTNKKLLNMYMKNKNLKTLIDVFELSDANGSTMKFE